MKECSDGRPFSGLVIGGLLAVGLASGAFAARPGEQNLSERDTFSLDLGTHKRQVQHWKRGGAVNKKSTQYWLVAQPLDGIVRIAEMADAAGFQVLGVHVDQDKTIYRIELKNRFDQVHAKLKIFEEFFSLEPLYGEDRVDQSLRREKDERNRKKWARSATGEKDPLLDTVRVRIGHRFSSDANALMWAKRQGIGNPIVNSRSELEGDVLWSQLESLSSSGNVDAVTPYFEGGPLNHNARAILGLRDLQFGASAQGFLDTISPFSATWNQSANAVGRGVRVGVFDGGVEDMHPDLRISPTQSRRASLTGETWNSGKRDPNGNLVDVFSMQHGTHVASSILGNGQLSAAFGYRPYQFRGVAPWAELFSFVPNANFHDVDVGNFSWVVSGGDGAYTNLDRQYDDLLANHAAGRRPIYLFAVGNNGTRPQYGSQSGHFSILNTLKNGIKVGAIDNKDKLKAVFSSMGPTRDGRVGPDVMAPGAGPSATGTVRVSSIAVMRGGAQLDLWSPNIAGNTLRTGGSTRSILRTGNKIEFQAGRAGWVGNGSNVVPWIVAAGDQIQFTLGGTQGGAVDLELTFRDLNNLEGKQTIPFQIPSTDATYIWSVDPGMVGFTFVKAEVLGDFPGGVGVVSAGFEISGSNNTYEYLNLEGTSQATPQVTGVVALMLEKFGKLTNRNIHTDRFWNSTARAILVHTATDMVDQVDRPLLPNNADFNASAGSAGPSQMLTDKYAVGPDWATGYGLVDATKAVEITGTSRVKEETISAISKTYSVTIPTGMAKFRATLAWDDPGSNRTTLTGEKMALVNDLDLALISPSGQIFRPWVLDHTTINDGITHADGIDPKVTWQNVQNNPAKPGVDRLNNLEVVDLNAPEAGVWTIVVDPSRISADQNPAIFGTNQDYSLITDIPVTEVTSYANLPAGAKGLRIGDATGGLMEFRADGVLNLADCSSTAPVTGGLEWSLGTSLKASLKRADKLRTVYSLTQRRFDVLAQSANLAGGLVVYNPLNEAMAKIGSDGSLLIAGAKACNIGL